MCVLSCGEVGGEGCARRVGVPAGGSNGKFFLRFPREIEFPGTVSLFGLREPLDREYRCNIIPVSHHFHVKFHRTFRSHP